MEEARLLCRMLSLFSAAARSIVARGRCRDCEALARSVTVVEHVMEELGC